MSALPRSCWGADAFASMGPKWGNEQTSDSVPTR